MFPQGYFILDNCHVDSLQPSTTTPYFIHLPLHLYMLGKIYLIKLFFHEYSKISAFWMLDNLQCSIRQDKSTWFKWTLTKHTTHTNLPYFNRFGFKLLFWIKWLQMTILKSKINHKKLGSSVTSLRKVNALKEATVICPAYMH